jgi:predicted PurR-regulated permease PerM
VTIKGESIQSLGQEPRTKASIYDVKGNDYKVEISGAGSLRQSDDSAEDSGGGATFEQIQPKVYGSMKWILTLAFSILTLGFILLYRAQVPVTLSAANREKPKSTTKDTNERRRR